MWNKWTSSTRFHEAHRKRKGQKNSMSYHSQGQEFDVAKALALAIHHAQEVARRDKVNAVTAEDRAQRVGIFVTSMRHFMPPGDIRSKLSLTALWYDIGHPKEPCGAYLSIGSVTENQLKTWLYEAHSLPVDLADIIDEELKELESNLPQLDVHIQQARRLNSEAQGVVDRLVDIFVPE